MGAAGEAAMKGRHPGRGVKRGLASLRLRRKAPGGGERPAARGWLSCCYELLYRSRRRVLLANVVSGSLIALSVYYLGQSALFDDLVTAALRLLWALRELAAQRRGLPEPLPLLVTVQAAVILLGAGICSYLSSLRAIVLGNLALIALVLLLNLAGFTFVPLSLAVVVLLITAGAALDWYLERQLQRRVQRRVADRQQSEHAILRHLSHSVNPTVQMALSPLRSLAASLEELRLMGEVIGRRRDGGAETIGDALETSMVSLRQIREILEITEDLFGNRVAPDDFQELALAPLIEQEIIPLFTGGRFALLLDCPRGATARLHRPSFVQALKNIVRNAEVHGFPDAASLSAEPYVRLEVWETVKEIEIEISNNGLPFPPGFGTDDFLAFGRKGKASPGKGLGGAWVKKCVEMHGGSFRKLANDPVRFRITLPRRRG